MDFHHVQRKLNVCRLPLRISHSGRFSSVLCFLLCIAPPPLLDCSRSSTGLFPLCICFFPLDRSALVRSMNGTISEPLEDYENKKNPRVGFVEGCSVLLIAWVFFPTAPEKFMLLLYLVWSGLVIERCMFSLFFLMCCCYDSPMLTLSHFINDILVGRAHVFV
ncbi:hypothetical protein VTN77DRAFT_3324 [Rasamsonia byssochlamydoides]|uniref:uncharacterized protein n=1 Tax=Rasamsonia byssochlamydoides TaxID=89139 RepID=UPI00374432CD